MDKYEVLKLITDAELTASRMILEATDILSVNKTDRRNVVTKYDEAVQKQLVDTLSKSIPEAHFFCEESSHPDTLDAEHVFIIDPIDGTMNFVHGMNCSCISVAYMHKGTIVAAAVYQPFSNEMFTAIKDGGAFLNGKQIFVDDCGLKNGIALLGTSPYYPDMTDRTFQIARELFNRCLDIRRSGSAANDLCQVAAGRAGIYYEGLLSFWDYAAGGLIVEEAGGRITNQNGGPVATDGSKCGVLAGGKTAVKEFIENAL